MTLTELSIKRPLLICVLFFVLIFFGALSYSNLNYNLLPKMETNVITVTTTYAGASPEEIKTSVTKVIEDAVAAIEGVSRLTSSSSEGVSSVMIELSQTSDVKQSQLDAERKIDQIKALLPQDADDPIVVRFSTDDQAIMKISVTSKLADAEFFQFIDNQIEPKLTNVAGVAKISIIGGVERQIRVDVDNNKLRAYNIPIAQVYAAVQTSGLSFSAGALQNNQLRYSIDLSTKVQTVDELRNLIIKQNTDGSRVQLKDVATVTDGQQEISTLNRLNSTPAIGIEIFKQTDANTVAVSAEVQKKLADIKAQYESYDFQYTIASDQSEYTLASADAVVLDLFLAVVIVAVVMLFFLHNLRSASFILVSLPSAMIPTFIMMYALGFSLNMMTLMALSLVVGILVDDSIVVLENIYRHLEMGKDKRTAALEGRNEIGFTAVGITLVDVVVFLPLALTGGIIGNIVREYALVIVFSTLMSLLVAFTLTPLMASRWGKVAHLDGKGIWGKILLGFESFINGLRDVYTVFLKWALVNKKFVIPAIFGLLILSFKLVGWGFVGAEFVPSTDRGELSVQIDLAPQTSIKETNRVVGEVEKILFTHPEVVTVFSNVGTQSGSNMAAAGASNTNLAEISVVLVDKAERSISTADFGKIIREEISQVTGVRPTIRLLSMMGSASFEIQMAVIGEDIDSVAKGAAILKDIIQKIPGTDYVQYNSKDAKAQVAIKLNRERMSAYGVSLSDVGSSIQLAFRGNDFTQFKERGQEYDINVQLEAGNRQSISDVRNFNIVKNDGSTIPLSEIATVEEKMSQSVLERKDRMESMQVNAAAIGRTSGAIMQDIQAELAKVQMPQGITVSQEGMSKNQGDAFGSLFLAIGIGVLLIYLIMVALYESLVYPFVVLFSIPVAIIGAILALALTLKTINIFSLLGIILLLGLVAKNGILIVDFANHQKEHGLSTFDALVEAGRERLRPILMTTLAMVFGLLPLALAGGPGSETKSVVAWVLIGGLMSSMILTVFIVPCMYMLVDTIKDFFSGKKKTEKID